MEMEPLEELSVLDVYKTAARGVRGAFTPAALYFLILTAWGLWSNLPGPSTGRLDPTDPAPALLDLIGFLVVLAALSWLACGIIRMALDGVRNRPLDWHRFNTPMADWAQVGVVGLVAALAIAAGFMLLIVPGVVLMLMWSQAYIAILDHRADWFAALSFSKSLTRGYKGAILLVFAILIIASMLIQVPSFMVMRDTFFSQVQGAPTQVPAVEVSPMAMMVIGASTILDSALQTFMIFVSAAIYIRLLQYHRCEETPAATPAGTMEV